MARKKVAKKESSPIKEEISGSNEKITPEVEAEIVKQVKKALDKGFDELLSSGKKICRPTFREGSYIQLKADLIYNQNGLVVELGNRDKNVEDWVEFTQ